MNATAPPPMRVENLSAYYGSREAVAGVTMSFAANAVTALMGPSGCGKTTLLRCLNVPARYVTGYLGDIAIPFSPDPMDFSAWFEVYLGGRWWTCDARHNKPRVARILMATGRDATDVALTTSFGPTKLVQFKVVTDEIK